MVFTDEFPHLKARFESKFSVPSKIDQNVFLGEWGQNVKFRFRNPKRHILARNDVFWRIERQNRRKGLGVAGCQNPTRVNTQ